MLVSGYARQDAFGYGSAPADDHWYANLSACRSVYGRAGIGREDIQGLGIYDNFSPTVLFSLEGLGFCPQGEAGRFVAGGTLELGAGRWTGG